MKSEWIGKAVSGLERLIKEPPYLIFVFIGTVFLILSLITKFGYDRSWIFLLYSIGGMMWRHAVRDLRGPIQKKWNKANFWVRFIYHTGNFALLAVLLSALFK